MNSKISTLLNFFNELSDVSFDGALYITPKDNIAIIDKYDIPYEPFGDNCKLLLNKFFVDIKVRYADILSKDIKIDDNRFIVVSNKTIISYDDTNSNPFQTHGLNNEDLLLDLKNLIGYYKIFNFIKSPNFSNYYNYANNHIVFYNNAYGILRVSFETIPKLNKDIDYYNYAGKLIDFSLDKIPSNDNLDNRKTKEKEREFIIKSIFNIAQGQSEISFYYFVEKIKDIIDFSTRDYQLYLKQFDFDKFRDSLYKEKEKYFNNIREIINKIFSQAIGIPISISASVFATYKVSDDSFLLLIVLLAFSVYVIFYIKIQFVFKSHIVEIDTDFKREFEIIKLKSGLDLTTINIERKKIEEIIKSSLSMINWLIGIIACLGLIVGIYIIYEVLKTEIVCLFRALLNY